MPSSRPPLEGQTAQKHGPCSPYLSGTSDRKVRKCSERCSSEPGQKSYLSYRGADNRRRDGLAQNSLESVTKWSLDLARAPLLGKLTDMEPQGCFCSVRFLDCAFHSFLSLYFFPALSCLRPWRVRTKTFPWLLRKLRGLLCPVRQPLTTALNNTPSSVPGCNCGSLGGLRAKCAWHVHVYVTEQRTLDMHQDAEMVPLLLLMCSHPP